MSSNVTETSRLFALPMELTQRICSHLSRGDIGRLALVSQDGKTLAEVLLYDHCKQLSPKDHIIRPLLRSVLDNPRLGKRIRRLTLLSWQKPPLDAFSDWAKAMDRLIQQLKEKTWGDQTALIEKHKKIRGREYVPQDQEMLLLLAQLPSLEYLAFDFPIISPFLEPLMNHARTSLPDSGLLFSKLVTLQVNHHFEQGGFSIPRVFPFLQGPVLSTWRAHRVKDYRADDPVAPFKPGSLAIQDINMVCAGLTDQELGDLIRGCRVLRDLRVVYARMGDNVGLGPNYGFESIIKALESHQKTLEDLVLDVSVIETYFSDEYTRYTRCQVQLKAFEKLRRLDLPVWPLLGVGMPPTGPQSDSSPIADEQSANKPPSSALPIVDVLPASLEELTIRNCREPHLSQLLPLAKESKEKLPFLQRLTIVEQCETKDKLICKEFMEGIVVVKIEK